LLHVNIGLSLRSVGMDRRTRQVNMGMGSRWVGLYKSYYCLYINFL